MIRRLIGTALLALMLVPAGAAVAAPVGGANSFVVPVTCDGQAFEVLTASDSAAVAWRLDTQGNPDGTLWVIKEFDLRAYPGTLTTEPTTDPVFAFHKTFGQKKGLGAALHCTFKLTETEEGQTFTAFGDAWVVQAR